MPRAIWMLGIVSLLMDVSSELIHSLLPLFMATTLGASALAIGLLEGVAEATALIVKIFSGALSDWLGKRKQLALIGYGLAALTKPFFAIADTILLVLVARFTDRIGKGIRGAPRDALIADITPAELRGAAFGLRQSLDTIGAVAGPLLAVGLMLLWANDFRAVFWVAVIPAVLSVLCLLLGVQEPVIKEASTRSNPLSRANLGRLGSDYWWVVAIGGVLTLARFSEAFLVLRATNVGMSLALAPLVMVVMNVVYAITAYPFGRLSDRLPRRALLAPGLLVLIVADLLLAGATDWRGVVAGVALWGVHMGMTQSALAALVADTAPADLRGTAFGGFNLISGLCLLLGSTFAGGLWQYFGAAFTFYAGAGFCALALLGLLKK